MWLSIAFSGYNSIYGHSDIPVLATNDVDPVFSFMTNTFSGKKLRETAIYVKPKHTANLHDSCQEYHHIDRIWHSVFN